MAGLGWEQRAVGVSVCREALVGGGENQPCRSGAQRQGVTAVLCRQRECSGSNFSSVGSFIWVENLESGMGLLVPTPT